MSGFLEESDLTLPIPVAPLKDGQIFVPPDTSILMVDVGLSFFAPNSSGLLRRNHTAFVIGFEPNPHHYFSYYAASDFADNLWLLTNRGKDARRELSRRRKNRYLKNTIFARETKEFIPEDLRKRFLFFPVAITEKNFERTVLYLHRHHGSSSLLENWNGLQENPGTLTVLGMRLDFFLNLLPSDGHWATHLKVDAEGSDLEVLRSAGQELDGIDAISVEDPATFDFLIDRGFREFKKQKGATTFINERFQGEPGKLDLNLRV